MNTITNNLYSEELWKAGLVSLLQSIRRHILSALLNGQLNIKAFSVPAEDKT